MPWSGQSWNYVRVSDPQPWGCGTPNPSKINPKIHKCFWGVCVQDGLLSYFWVWTMGHQHLEARGSWRMCKKRPKPPFWQGTRNSVCVALFLCVSVCEYCWGWPTWRGCQHAELWYSLFWFLVCNVFTQVATQLFQRRIQVVRSNKVTRERLTESNSTPPVDLGHFKCC